MTKVYAYRYGEFGTPFAAFTTREAAVRFHEGYMRTRELKERSTDCIVELSVWKSAAIVGGDGDD